jgi:hypothetical protein
MRCSAPFHCAIAALALAALAGCAKGPMAGNLVLPNQAPQRVTLNYESSLFGGSGKLWAVLPSGERFAGRYVLMPYAAEHHIVSTLDGDRGGSMLCRFTLRSPGVGPDGGGTGKCQLSEGGTIDTRF